VAFDLLIRNAILVTADGRRAVDIGTAGGRFRAIEPAGTLAGAKQELDAIGLAALPGLIDGHVHFRQPGREHEEDWETGTRAAVMGGVTTVLEMPNTDPPTDDVERAHRKLELAGKAASCDFGIFGLLGESVESVAQLAESGLIVGLKTFMGPTTGGLSAPDEASLHGGLRFARAAGLRICFHAEDRTLIESTETELRAAGRADALAHLESRPEVAESAAVEQVGRLLVESGARGHVAHVTSAEGLAAIEQWRLRGADLTCEATPHHLLLDLAVYAEFGGVAKVNPPIRGQPHASALMAALADGRIECLASDHAPHLAADKQRDSIWEVPAGIPGVETMLPLLLTEVSAGRLSLERLAHATSEAPARAWGLWPRKGAVQVGSDADLTLVDPTRKGVVRAAALHGKNNLSPFEGRPTVGAPVATIVRGRIVVRDGEFDAEPGWGKPVSRS
jgi:dihydroorotase